MLVLARWGRGGMRGPGDGPGQEALRRLERRVEDLGWAMERASLAEYVRLFDRPLRLAGLNFLAGLARGVGIAVGFLVLGAVLIYFLRVLLVWNLPGIGRFVAAIVRIVQQELRLRY